MGKRKVAGTAIGSAAIVRLVTAIGLAAMLAGLADAQVNSVRIAGGHPDEASELTARVAPGRTLHMTITLALHDREGLSALLAAQQDPSSPEYHKWLTPAQFNARFGPTEADVLSVRDWLTQQGFKVDFASADSRTIAFHSDAATAERAFSVRIAASPEGKTFANLDDPAIPTELASKVGAISGLSNTVHHRPAVKVRPGAKTIPAAGPPFGPKQVWNFYDYTTLEGTGVVGSSSDCIALIEVSDVDSAGSISGFDSEFGLPSPTLTTIFADDGSDPGAILGDSLEAVVDIEVANAAAPGTPIRDYVGDDNVSDSAGGGLQDALQRAVSDNLCGQISMSFGFCGEPKLFYTEVFDQIFAQAEAQGQGVYVAAGDQGAAGLMFNARSDECVPGSSRHVSEVAADPHVTAVGGTQFQETGENSSFVAESVWDDPAKLIFEGQEGTLPAADRDGTGGGVSQYFPKPTFQNGVTPNDNHRDVPDVSFVASGYFPGLEVFFGGQVTLIEGTSFGTPWWAAISALAGQEAGSRIGNLNPAIYALGAKSNSALHDVVTGNNSLHGVTGFSARKGYDCATGWGTPDIGLLVPLLAGS
ncbi:MAG TPA: S53 family peptidase [Candidatus Binataceae bacterium]|nr:S53 family peptidase [Candidatus Binataceae bacterium]